MIEWSETKGRDTFVDRKGMVEVYVSSNVLTIEARERG